MARPIFDPSEQIKSIGEDMRSNIGGIGDYFIQRKQIENEIASNTAESIQVLSDELGDIHKEYLDEELSALQKDFQQRIFKERKVGGTKLDASALNEFRTKIRKVKRLAENSQQIDKLYAEAEATIASNKYIKGDHRRESSRRVLSLLADPENLMNYDTTLLKNELNSIIRASEDDLSILKDNIDIGYDVVNVGTTDGPARYAKVLKGSTVKRNSDGSIEVEVPEAVRSYVDQTIQQLGLGLSTDEALEAIKVGADAEFRQTTMGKFDREARQTSIDASKTKLTGDNTRQGIIPEIIGSKISTGDKNEDLRLRNLVLSVLSGHPDVDIKTMSGADIYDYIKPDGSLKAIYKNNPDLKGEDRAVVEFINNTPKSFFNKKDPSALRSKDQLVFSEGKIYQATDDLSQHIRGAVEGSMRSLPKNKQEGLEASVAEILAEEGYMYDPQSGRLISTDIKVPTMLDPNSAGARDFKNIPEGGF